MIWREISCYFGALLTLRGVLWVVPGHKAWGGLVAALGVAIWISVVWTGQDPPPSLLPTDGLLGGTGPAEECPPTD